MVVTVAAVLWIVISFLPLNSGSKDAAITHPTQNAIEARALDQGTTSGEVPSPKGLSPDPIIPPPSTNTRAKPADNYAAPAPRGPVTVPQPEPVMPGAAPPIGLTVEAAGIEVAILPLTPTDTDIAGQSIIPPLTEDGYWLTPYGTPGTGSDNTTYVVGHSWEGREVPFDRFSTETEVGDTVVLTTTAGSINYVVDSVTTYEKASLRATQIWDIVPNRLIIISCYTEDPWGKNVVVSASPLGS
ncbi:UNVERIFIED_ORG: hypothetical protein J2X79_004327 [Arthrobacter globiformis]|nr:hypothetical protein [Arthrobacter globiformis]